MDLEKLQQIYQLARGGSEAAFVAGEINALAQSEKK